MPHSKLDRWQLYLKFQFSITIARLTVVFDISSYFQGGPKPACSARIAFLVAESFSSNSFSNSCAESLTTPTPRSHAF